MTTRKQNSIDLDMDKAVAVTKVIATLAKTPAGVPENALYRHWHGSMTKSQFDDFLQDGVSSGSLIKTPEGKYQLANAIRNSAPTPTLDDIFSG